MNNYCDCGREAFKLQGGKPVCMYCFNGQLTVRYTGTRISRNQICPCGSGKKFKNCHRADTFVTVQKEMRRAVDSVRPPEECGEGHGSLVRDPASADGEPVQADPEAGVR